jgi:hypothetical protein
VDATGGLRVSGKVIHVALAWFRRGTAPGAANLTQTSVAVFAESRDESANSHIAKIIADMPQRRKRQHGKAA